ncbi:MAG: hypothetical protein K1X67_08020 [Fimbriimonadaceae bacterium]|nr:hypothetical protein [Fimbriimonadaceae bacterium]
MNLLDLFTKRAPVADDPPPVADAPAAQPEPSGADIAFVQGVLDNAAKTMADAFVTSLLNEQRIVPAQVDQWREAFLQALRTDGGGKIAASGSGAVLEGSMTAQVRSLAAAQPKHTLTQSVLPGAPEGSVLISAPGDQVAAKQAAIARYRSVGGPNNGFGGVA